MAKPCMSRTAAKWMVGISSLVLTICLAALLVFPTIYKQILTKQITLTDGSLISDVWEDIPLPLYERLYFFNISNADHFLKNGEALNVTEIGPYTYKGRWVKDYRVWNPNGTVSYREVRTYQFVPEMSVGSQDDIINTLNGPMVIAASILKDYNIVFRLAVAAAMGLEGETVVIQRSVRQLVYEGYKDPIIEYAPIIKPNLPYKNGIFSWLYGKNATDDGLFTVYTGVDDASLTNIINNWNGKEATDFWKNDSCNEIKGTSIETGPPLKEIPEPYTFFQSIFCRSITYNYTEDQTHYGVSAKRFRPTYMELANSTENPANECYEVNKEHPSGILDISPCQFGAPVYISYPHFFMADPIYLQKINGLNPNEAEHNSHLDVDPITGITVDVSVKFQINVEIQDVAGIPQLTGVPEGIFPVFWIELQIQMNEEWAKYLKGQLNNPKIIGYSVLGGFAFISFILIIVGAVILHQHQKSDKTDPLLEKQRKSSISSNSKVPFLKASNTDKNYSTEKQNSSHVQEDPSTS